MSSLKVLTAVLLCLGCVLVSSSPAVAGGVSPTTTVLALSSSSVAAETAVTLTATVTSGGNPITTGQVTFCDATAAHCDGAAVLGVAQLTGAGTASIKFRPGVGTYSIQAVFAPFSAEAGSTSSAHALTVTAAANYVTSTTIGSAGSTGNYTLTSTVTAFGRATPTGTVSFLDTTSGNVAVSSAALDPASLATVFIPATGSPITGEPQVQFVVTGDVNNDGIPDLAILNQTYNGSIDVFLGNGDGTFQTPVSNSVGQYPAAMTTADINGDGKLDLIVSNSFSNTVGVMLGNGDGTFQAQVTYATGNEPEFIAVGDFNRDGFLDLAIPNNPDGTVGILLGNGDGTFQTEVTYAVGSFSIGVAIGDFNQDGLLDLAVSNQGDATLSILLGNGDGTFQAQQIVNLPSNTYPYWLVSGDLRKNGKSDLVVPDSGSANVYVLLSNGDGTFATAVDYTVGDAPWGVALGDINGDGSLDLVVADTGADGLVSVLINNGDGTFAAKTDYSVGNNPTNVAVADFNGDGMLDIATADGGPSTSTILLQAQTETAIATGVSVIGSGTHNVLASYPGDVERAASQSTTVPLIGAGIATTVTALTASPNPATAGQSVTLTATITPAPTGSPLGTVNFYNGETLVGTSNVNSSGVATFSTSALPTGSNSITAVYSGNYGFATSASTVLTEVINGSVATPTTTVLSATPNPAGMDNTVTLTATVAPTPTGSPLGTVSFYNGETLLGTSNLNSSGVATLTTNSLPSGSLSITAVYSGNTGFAGSTSSAFAETVGTAFTVTAPQTPFTVAAGGAVNINVTVPPLGGVFNNVVTMSATGLPPGATSSFNPPTVTPGANGAPTVLTIQLASRTAKASEPNQNSPRRHFPVSALALTLGFCGIGLGGRSLTRNGKRLFALIILCGALFTLIGCSGGFAGSSPTHPGSYVVTITGTSGSLHASTTVTVVVQ